jgi:hypothetical protein
VPVRPRSGTGVHMPAERKRALAVHSVCAVEAAPDGELPGGGSAAIVQDRGEGTGLAERLVEPGGMCGRPRDPSSTEFVYVTVWEDVESIRAFAGERWEEAVVAPDEERLLENTWIAHYEVF